MSISPKADLVQAVVPQTTTDRISANNKAMVSEPKHKPASHHFGHKKVQRQPRSQSCCHKMNKKLNIITNLHCMYPSHGLLKGLIALVRSMNNRHRSTDKFFLQVSHGKYHVNSSSISPVTTWTLRDHTPHNR